MCDYPFSHSQTIWGLVALLWLDLIIFPWRLTFSFIQSTSGSCHPVSVSVNNSGQGISLQLPNLDYSPYASFTSVKNTVTFYIYLWKIRNVFSILHFWFFSLSSILFLLKHFQPFPLLWWTLSAFPGLKKKFYFIFIFEKHFHRV